MRTFFTLIIIVFGYFISFEQCNPPAALDCESANVLCSLDELDGYACNNPDISNPTGPSPLCFGTGAPENTNWWAFVGNGSFLTMVINFDPSDCESGGIGCSGIEVGILDDCGGDPLDCNADCNTSTITLSGQTLNCHTYYIWIDGCCGDVCNYTIDVSDGGPPSLPHPLPTPYLIGRACPCGIAEICVNDPDQECDARKQWTIDGVDRPDWDDLSCLELELDETGAPIEICVTWTIGNPANPMAICDQESTCVTIVPEAVELIIVPPLFVCWEDHEGGGYVWRDSVIYTSCISPPCRKRVLRSNTCCVDYEAEIELLPQRPIAEVYKFICDKSELPFITEDGQVWLEEVCGEEITWQDPEYYNCDTTYILYFSIFDPKVTLKQDCGPCDEFVTLLSEIEYLPECIYGNVTWTGYWLNEFLDTIGVGDKLQVTDEGTYHYVMHVNYVDNLTGEVQECDLEGLPPWVHEIKYDTIATPVIESIRPTCSNSTVTYTVNNKYEDVCGYDWQIKNGDGVFISNSTDSAVIIIDWKNLKEEQGKLCVTVKTDCGISSDTCISILFSSDEIGQLNDTIVCGKEFSAINISNQKDDNWLVIKSAGNISLGNDGNETTMVVDEFGEYRFIVNTHIDSCVTYDTISIHFVDVPFWNNVNIICDSVNDHYRVLFEANNGDTSSWKARDHLGKTLDKVDQNTFITEWINNGDSISIMLSDKYNCSTLSLDTVFDCLTLEVNDLDQNNFQLTPNPVHKFLNIKGSIFNNNLNEINIHIIDLNGNVIQVPPKAGISGGVQLNVEKLLSGMYFIQLQKGDINSVLRFIVL